MLQARKIAAVGLLFGLGAAAALAQNPPVTDRGTALPPDGKVVAATAFPTGKLKGLHIKNPKGETVGSVDDLVIGLDDGKVHYIAMSVGGVLGIGDKLFAVPFRE